MIKKVENIVPTLREAFYVAKSGRPGPVVVDFPKDIQGQTADYSKGKKVTRKSYKPVQTCNREAIEKAVPNGLKFVFID